MASVKEAIEEMKTLPNSILELENKMIELKEEVEQAKRGLENFETEIAIQVENATGPDGKKFFTNEIKRKVAMKERLDGKKEYQDLWLVVNKAELTLNQTKAKRDFQARMFRLYEILLNRSDGYDSN